MANVTCDSLEWNALFVLETVISYPLSAVAITAQVMCLSLIPKVGIFPANVKLILFNGTLAAFFVCFTFLIRAFYNSLIMIFGFKSFSLQILPCLALDAPFGTATAAFVLSMLALALERTYETIKFRPSETSNIDQSVEKEKSTKGAKALLVLVWCLAPIWSIQSTVQVRTANRLYCYCIAAAVHEKAENWTGKSIYFAVAIFTILLTGWVWLKNRNRLADFNINTKEHNLQSRFHASNNMKTTAMLFPYVVAHAAFYVVVVALNYEFNILSNNNSSQSIAVINSQIFLTLVASLDFIIGPLIWMRNHDQLKTLAAAKYPFLKKIVCLKSSKTQSTTVTLVSNLIGKRNKDQLANAPANGNAVEYRVKPEQHREILEHLWAKK